MNAQVARIERKLAVPKPRPAKLICVNGRIIADAVVIVSPKDPNWFRHDGYKAYRTNDVVTVRRT